jgi:hypothetical protein
MSVDAPLARFHNRLKGQEFVTSRQNSLERALEEAVSRALRDNLAPLQRTADELHQAYSDLVAACASTRPSNALPAMLRAQTAAAALAAGLSVLSNFVAVALNPRENDGVTSGAPAGVAEPEAAEPVAARPSHVDTEIAEPRAHEVAAEIPPHAEPEEPDIAPIALEAEPEPDAESIPVEAHVVELSGDQFIEPPASAAAQVSAFEIAALAPELQDLHRRANRVAKVAMQDIKLLRPKDVQSGREHKDLCERLRSDLDKARKEYDRRFRAISDHPVDYFHHWAIEILAGGDGTALGEYPYPSPVLRH